jgi:DNA-binding NarL/FixJ family response regulator
MRLLICDDHVMLSEAFAELIAELGHVAFVCSNPDSALEAARGLNIDVCLMDLNFDSGESGIDAIAEITNSLPHVKVVVLSGFDDEDTIRAAREAGASGYICKSSSAMNVVDAVCNKAYDNYFVIRSDPVDDQASKANRKGSRFSIRSLTARELEVLEHLIDGASAAQIAMELQISYATARTHIQRILTKLGAHNRLEAVARANAQGVGGRSAPSTSSRRGG